jgi:hypothetical protein
LATYLYATSAVNEGQCDILEQGFDCITVPQVGHVHSTPHQRHRVISGKLEGYYSKLNILPVSFPEYALELQNEARTNHDQHPHIQLGSRSDLIGDKVNVPACGIFIDIIVT